MTIERLTLDGVYELRDAGGRAYPQVIRVSGGTQVFLSGMVALDADGALIGEGDMAAQAAATYANVGQALWRPTSSRARYLPRTSTAIAAPAALSRRNSSARRGRYRRSWKSPASPIRAICSKSR